jgi:hypothetical protein
LTKSTLFKVDLGFVDSWLGLSGRFFQKYGIIVLVVSLRRSRSSTDLEDGQRV